MAATTNKWIRIAWRNESWNEQISLKKGSRKSNEKGRSDCII